MRVFGCIPTIEWFLTFDFVNGYMVSTESSFLIFGSILIIGYLGELLSKRFAVPSALLLLLIGFSLRLSGYVDVSALVSIQDLFGSLALIVLLFDGGLSLNLYEIVFKSGRVLSNAILTTILGIAGCVLLFSLLGFNPIMGAILGAIAGGIGSTTTISITKGLSLPPQIKNFLTLESSMTDVFSIILALVLTQALISGAVDLQSIGQGILGKFTIGAFAGIFAGIASIMVLAKIEKGYNYMITFALFLILFAITDFFGGSGAIAVLIFGVVFGNEAAIRKMFKLNHNGGRPLIKQFQSEISFFIRTFFFVFLGVIVDLGSLTNFLIAFILLVMFYAIRYISVYLSTFNSTMFDYRKILTAVNPRGLATAVLATYPVIMLQNTIKLKPDDSLQQLLSQMIALPEIAFYLIILSIISTTILVPLVVRDGNKDKEEKE